MLSAAVWRIPFKIKDIVMATIMLKTSLKQSYFVITKTCLSNVDPFKPHFYIVKLGFTGVYIIFPISAQNIDCRYSLEPQFIFGAEIRKISEFLSEKFHILVVKFSVYMNRRVFVMVQELHELKIVVTCSVIHSSV